MRNEKKSGRKPKRKATHHGSGRGNKKVNTVAPDAYNSGNNDSECSINSESSNDLPSCDENLYLDKDFNAIINLSDLFHVIADNFSSRSSMSAGMICLLDEFVIHCRKKLEDAIKKS